jgi:soluble P-type ATPase
MMTIEIPGFKKLEIAHLVFDYNGTLAIDGKLIEGVKPLLELLSKQLTIHILTADTFGTSQQELSNVNCKLTILTPKEQDIQKMLYVAELGKENVISIGNGKNDALMMREAALSIMLIQQEGAYGKLTEVSDIICLSIIDAMNLLLNPKRLIATLRK